MFIQRKNEWKWLTMALMICLMCSVSSCGSDGDDENDSAMPYVGTWERTEGFGEDAIKQKLIITETSFTVSMKMRMDDEWVDMALIEGSYSKSGDIFKLTLTRVGILMEGMTELTYFTPDDINWDDIIDEELEIEDYIEVKFIVEGNELNLIFDENGDGLYDPIMEGEIYFRI